MTKRRPELADEQMAELRRRARARPIGPLTVIRFSGEDVPPSRDQWRAMIAFADDDTLSFDC